MAKNKYLSNSERMEVEHGLRHGLSIKKIAAKIGKRHATVAREILARSIDSDQGAFGRLTHRCVSRHSCSARPLCEDKPDCVKRCSACRLGNSMDPDFHEEFCAKLAAAPHVRNGCKQKSRCVLRKRYSLHRPAHRAYRDLLVGTRQGAHIIEDELCSLDALVSPRVRQEQSVHHILTNHPDPFDLPEKTVYRHIAAYSEKQPELPMALM